MELDGDQEIQPANSESAAASLKRLRWPVLITGVAGAAILVAFQLGLIPGVQDLNGSLGAIGVFCGAAFVGAGGVVGWWVWTRLANSRTRRVTLTAQGILVVFNDEASALLSWADTNLHMTIKEFSNPGNRSRFDYSVGEGWNASIRVRDPRRSRARKDHIHGSWIPVNEHAKWKTTLRVESHGDLESIAALQTTPFLLRARRLSRTDTGYLSREGAMDFSHRDVSTNSDCQRRLSRRARLDLGGPPAPATNARTIGSTRTYVLSV